MDCTRFRTAVSARLDGEELPVPEAALRQHLAGCAACRRFEAGASALHRRTRLAPAEPVPNLSARVLAALEPPTPAPSTSGLRVAVALIGLLQLGLSVPALILGSEAGVPVHAARHLGSFGVALGVGLIVAAWRPQRVHGLLPLASALVVCLVGCSVVDVATHYATVTSELTHLVEVVGLLGLWLLSRSPDVGSPEAAPRLRAA